MCDRVPEAGSTVGGWGVAGLQVGVTRTPHPSHEQATLVLPHWLQPSGRGDFIIQTAAGLRGGGGGSGVGWGILGGWWVLLSTVSHKRDAKGSISIVRPN